MKRQKAAAKQKQIRGKIGQLREDLEKKGGADFMKSDNKMRALKGDSAKVRAKKAA